MTLNGTSIYIVRSGAILEIDGGTITRATINALPGSTVIIKNNGCVQLRQRNGLQIEEGALMDYKFGKIKVTN